MRAAPVVPTTVGGPEAPEALTQRSPTPWLCRRHRRAGQSGDRWCCRGAAAIGAREATAWFALRLAARTEAERERIRATVADPHGCRARLARHAGDLGRGWAWLRTPPPCRRAPTARDAPRVRTSPVA